MIHATKVTVLGLVLLHVLWLPKMVAQMHKLDQWAAGSQMHFRNISDHIKFLIISKCKIIITLAWPSFVKYLLGPVFTFEILNLPCTA